MRVSIKATLLCLIGAIGAAMLLSDASGLNALKNVRSGLATVYEDRVIPLRDLKIIADSYAVLIVDTSHKVRNGGMDWSSGVAAVADSLKKIDRSWRSYTGTYLNPEEKLLVETLKPLMSTADDAAQRLIGILNRHDSGALDHFVRKDLYPSIDPVSERISDLIELQVRVAGAEYDRAQDQARFASVTAWVLIAVAAFLIVGAVLTVLRKVTTPIEHLTDAMSRLAANDLGTAIPAVAQRDEVGEMARAVEVFKRNMIETERMRNEQEAIKRRADEDKRRTMNELADSFEQSVKGIVQTVSSAASQLHANARNMSSIADQTARQSTVVAAATEQASANVQTVAAAAEELGSSIDEIGRHVTESARISHEAVGEAERTNAIVEGLASAAHRIGDVVALIQGIASQTNLLALNATIEAARAGEAGKGFAVVASEVKQLANQTAGATEEISTQILEIQAQTVQAVQAIGRIGQTIASVNQISGAIAAAVEEQTAATREIGRNIQQAAQGTQEVSGTIVGVSKAAEEAGTASSEVLTAAGQVADEADRLRTEVDRFVARVRAA